MLTTHLPEPELRPGWAGEPKWDGVPDTQMCLTSMCHPFPVKAIGTLRGVLSLATQARRVTSVASSYWLTGRFTTSMTPFGRRVRLLHLTAVARPVRR